MAKTVGDQKTDRVHNDCRPWLRWLFHLIVVVLVGVILLPFFRIYPPFLHDFLSRRLSWWQQKCFLGLVSALLAFFFLRVFQPRRRHLCSCKGNPPIWLAWVLAFVLVGAWDWFYGVRPKEFIPLGADYVVCILGIVLGWVLWLVLGRPSNGTGSYGEASSSDPRGKPAPFAPSAPSSSKGSASSPSAEGKPQESAGQSVPEGEENKEDQKNEETLDWQQLKKWLQSDDPAEEDHFGIHRPVAERLAHLLREGTKSIGIIGPWGSGKTTIVQWIMKECLEDAGQEGLIFSVHSCWGFETSAGCVYEMLGKALQELHKLTDTFSVSGLPRAYRRALFGNREWLEAFYELFFGAGDWQEQFSRLSDLLERINARLVFVVEDLDRSAKPQFHIAEVTGFLQQLKGYRNLQFILTAAPQATQEIDFPRLCEHIELLRPLEAERVAEIVLPIRKACLAPKTEKFHPVSILKRNHWEICLLGKAWMLPQLTEALSAVLFTPRALKHALRATLTAWGWWDETKEEKEKKHKLAGEVEWDSLLVLNTLRFAAPEVFSFLLRNWEFLRRDFSKAGEYTRKDARKRVQEDWEATVKRGNVDTRPIRELIDFILPYTPQWLDNKDALAPGVLEDRSQGLEDLRYWYRAIRGSLEPNEIRDQAVLWDIQNWLEKKSSPLVEKLQTSDAYTVVFAKWALHVFAAHLAQTPETEQTSVWNRVPELVEELLASIGPYFSKKEFERLERVIEKMIRVTTVVRHNPKLTGFPTKPPSSLPNTLCTVCDVLTRAILQNDNALAAVAFASVYLLHEEDISRRKILRELPKILDKMETLIPQIPDDFLQHIVRKGITEGRKWLNESHESGHNST